MHVAFGVFAEVFLQVRRKIVGPQTDIPWKDVCFSKAVWFVIAQFIVPYVSPSKISSSMVRSSAIHCALRKP